MWQDLTTFLEMGGYGAFVWPAYALTLALLIVLYLATRHSIRKHEHALKGLGADDQ
jgi:heme exporter protein CcmD